MNETQVNLTSNHITLESKMAHSFKHIISTVGVTPYYTNKDENGVLFNANCFDITDSIPADSIDMIFADPPYFLPGL